MVSLGLFWTGGSKVEGLSVPNVAEKKMDSLNAEQDQQDG